VVEAGGRHRHGSFAEPEEFEEAEEGESDRQAAEPVQEERVSDPI
jgi:hypothetical protein